MQKTKDGFSIGLKNEFCAVGFYGENIKGRDLTDMANESRFFTQNKQGLKKQWEAIEKEFNDETTMYDVMELITVNGGKVHSYCAVD